MERQESGTYVLFTEALLSSEPPWGGFGGGEQIRACGPLCLWEFTSTEAEWAQCGVGHHHGSHTHTQQLINCHLVLTPQLSPEETLPPGFKHFPECLNKIKTSLTHLNHRHERKMGFKLVCSQKEKLRGNKNVGTNFKGKIITDALTCC